jgi:hypothetical protein
MHNPGMHWRSILTLVALVPLAACLETDLTLRPDGAVTGTIGWVSSTGVPEAAARSLLTADGVTIKKLELKDPTGTPPKSKRISAEIEAKSPAALAAMPLLKSLNVTATLADPADGKRKLTVRAAKSDRLGDLPDTDSVVRLHLPGTVAESSAKSSGNDVTWTVPASEFKSKGSVELTVVYAAPAAAAPAKGN